MNRFGATSAPVSVSVVVVPPPGVASPADQTAFASTVARGATEVRPGRRSAAASALAGLRTACSVRCPHGTTTFLSRRSLPQALAVGDTDSALSLATGASSLLNELASAAAQQGEEQQQSTRAALRAELLSVVSDAVSVLSASMSTAVLEAAAAAVQALTAAPGELSDGAQGAALALLGRLAAAQPPRGQAPIMTAAAAASIAEALGNVVNAAAGEASPAHRRQQRRGRAALSALDPAAAAVTLQKATAVVDALAASLAAAEASVPGQQATTVAAPAVQARALPACSSSSRPATDTLWR